MPDSTLILMPDVNDPQQNGLQEDFLNVIPAVVPEFVKGDKSLAVLIRPIIAADTANQEGGLPWADDYVSGDAFTLAIGNPDEPPSGGTFALDLDGNTTGLTALDWDSTALEVQTPLSAASVTEGFGALTVTKPADGVYVVTWTNTGSAVPAIEADASGLLPNCEPVVSVIFDGDETPSTHPQQIITFRQQNVALSQPATTLTAAGVTRTYQQVASAVQNMIVRIAFDAAGTYGGLYSINVIAGGYSAAAGLAGPLMTPDELGAVLANHPAIDYGDETAPNNLIITKDGDDFLIEFIGTLAGPALANTITAATVANPSVLTTGTAHNYRTGDSVTFSNSTGFVPSLNGTQTITVVDGTHFSIPVNVTTGTGSADVFNTSESTMTVANVSLLAPKGVKGVLNLNTYNLANAFWQTTADSLSFTMSIERTRSSGEVRTLLLVPVTIKREIIDVTSLVPLSYTGGIQVGNMVYVDDVLGNDANTGYFGYAKLTLTGAKAAASSGDTIKVFPGGYDERNLLKAGVSWNLEAGTEIVYTGDVTGGIFDDSASGLNAAFVGQIVGASLIDQRGDGQAFTLQYAVNVTHADSDVTIIANSIECNPDASGDQIETAAINQEDGIIRVECQTIVANTGPANYAVWWRNGEMNINALTITGTFVTLYPQVTATPTGQGYVKTQLLQNTGASGITIYHSSIQTSARFWVDAMQIECTDTGHAINSDGTGKLYVVGVQKILGRCIVTAGDIYVEAMKWSANAAGDLIVLSGGTVQMLLDLVSDEGLLTGNVMEVTSGTHVITGMRFTGGASALGVNITGGTLTLRNCYIKTTANSSSNPLIKSGGKLVLIDCTIIAHSSREWLSAGTAQDVYANQGTSVFGANATPTNVTIKGAPYFNAEVANF